MPQNCDYSRLILSLTKTKTEQSKITVDAVNRAFSEGKREEIVNSLQLQERINL